MPPKPKVAEAGSLSPARRALKNFTKLLRGRGVAALLDVVTIGALARTLSPDQLGFVVLVQTYVLFLRSLLDFNLYEVLVRFGVPLMEGGDEAGFKDLLVLTLLIDVGSCLVATVVAIVSAPLAGIILNWDDSLPMLTIVYSFVLLTYGIGTAKGVLRIFDRYDALGVQLMISPVLRLAGVLLVMLLQPTVLWFVVILAIGTGAGNVYLIVRGWLELQRRMGGLRFEGALRKTWRGRFDGLGRFIGVVYWQSNLDIMPRYISTLLAGLFLGPAAAGYLRLANEATKIISKPGALLRQVLFPDMMRMWLRQSGEFGALLRKALLVSAAFGLAVAALAVLGGGEILGRALGEAYRQAAPLLSLVLFAATMELLATVMRSAGYAMGHAGKVFRFNLVGAFIYLAAFVVLTPAVGLLGPGFAALLGSALPLVAIGALVFRNRGYPPGGQNRPDAS